MKKLSEILANKATPEPAIQPNTEPAAPPVLESKPEEQVAGVAAETPAPVETTAPATAFAKRYLELLEGYGVKSIVELDGEKLDEFHTKILEAIKTEEPAEAEAK